MSPPSQKADTIKIVLCAGDKLGAWNEHKHTTIYKIDNQQGPTVKHRELYSISCNNPSWKRILKRIYITESLCCTPETNTTL